MKYTISSSREDVQAALDGIEADYIHDRKVVDDEAKRLKAILRSQRDNQHRKFRRLLAVVDTKAQPAEKAEAGGDDEILD